MLEQLPSMHALLTVQSEGLSNAPALNSTSAIVVVPQQFAGEFRPSSSSHKLFLMSLGSFVSRNVPIWAPMIASSFPG